MTTTTYTMTTATATAATTTVCQRRRGGNEDATKCDAARCALSVDCVRVRLCVCYKDEEIEGRLDDLKARMRQYRSAAQLVSRQRACTRQERHWLNDSGSLFADELGRLLDRRRGLAAFQTASAHDKVARPHPPSPFTVITPTPLRSRRHTRQVSK